MFVNEIHDDYGCPLSDSKAAMSHATVRLSPLNFIIRNIWGFLFVWHHEISLPRKREELKKEGGCGPSFCHY